jgi:uncharacterized protein with NRDE domain
VCLLIALSRVLTGAPLLVAANRDERYDRPAEVITVLRAHGPRILGGRDAVAGGTWLAVNEHGLVAGLTNQPLAGPRDDTRRSRGELPLAFAAHRDAATAVAKVCAELDPSDYNPCWLLVGDRHSLFSVGMTGGHRPVVRRLPPGSYVLENVPLDDYSAKARQVGQLVAAGIASKTGRNGANGVNAADETAATHGATSEIDGPGGIDQPREANGPSGTDRHSKMNGPSGTDRHSKMNGPSGTDRHSKMNGPSGTDRHSKMNGQSETDRASGMGSAEQALAAVLRDHRPAVEPKRHPAGRGRPAGRGSWSAERIRPAELSAACVHTASYGTRSAMIVSVGGAGLPRVFVSDGPPCQAPFQNATALWAASAPDATH